jgi:hypothetical protein
VAPSAGAAAANAAVTPGLDPANLLLFSVELDGSTLTDGLASYGDPADPLLPVGDLTRLLEFDVQVTPAERRITGNLGESRRSLLVDLGANIAKVGPKEIPIKPGDVVVAPTEIYIKASFLQELLPLKIKSDAESLALKLTATELLPIESRKERESRRENITPGQAQEETLKVRSPYRLYSMPAFDVTLNTGFQTVQTPKVPLEYDIRAAMDLAFMDFQAYAGTDETGKLNSSRFLFERRSIEGNLLWPLHARSIDLGDTYTPSLSIGPRSIDGRGFSFSTVPLDQSSVFNHIDLRGELPLGYDVELYVNDVLRSGQNTPDKGRYEFLDVPLARGINVVRIVTYGPHGERSEETRIVNVGGGLLQKGEATFEFGVVQQQEPLLQVSPNLTTTSITQAGVGQWRAVGSLNYGLTQTLTIAAGAALVPVNAADQTRGEFTLGARTSLFGVATQVDLAGDTRGGAAAQLGLSAQYFGVSTVFRHAQFTGRFFDENGGGSDPTRPLSSRTEVTFDGTASFRGSLVPLNLRAIHDSYVDGGQDLSISTRGSATVYSTLVTGGFEFSDTQAAHGASNNVLTGFLAVSTFRNFKWQLRSTLDYDLVPDLKPRNLAITLDGNLSPTTAIRFGIGEPLDSLSGINLTASWVQHLRFADLSFNADYNNQNHAVQIGAQVSFGLDYNPQKHGYEMTRPGPGGGGSVLFQAFLDRNGNGIFDEGDEPVKNVQVEAGVTRVFTGADGRVFITGLGAGPTARLFVSLEKVDNVQVQAPPNVVEFTPRPGGVTVINYPLKPTGDVMVRLLLARPDGSKIGIAAVQLQMVNEKGQAFRQSTEFDGSAEFTNLPIGVYHLQIDPDQAQRLRMKLTTPVTVTIKGDGSFIPDQQAELRFEPRAE